MSRYTIVKLLGSGTFASAYQLKIQTEMSESEYAIKVISMRRPDIDYLNEARIMFSLSHTNLVQCYAYFEASQTLYLVLELANGTLNHYIKAHQKADKLVRESAVLRMLCQLADVLRYLLAKKVIHRDIKPDNIFLDDDTNIKIGDVGIARQLDRTSELLNDMAGTLRYMSPEALCGKSYNAKTDIWSLGCCVHELMTLRQTFENIRLVVELKIPEIPSKDYSKELRTLVLQMLEENPVHRPDAHEIYIQTCKIRNKRHIPGTSMSIQNFKIDQKKVCEAVRKFSERSLMSNCDTSIVHQTSTWTSRESKQPSVKSKNTGQDKRHSRENKQDTSTVRHASQISSKSSSLASSSSLSSSSFQRRNHSGKSFEGDIDESEETSGKLKPVRKKSYVSRLSSKKDQYHTSVEGSSFSSQSSYFSSQENTQVRDSTDMSVSSDNTEPRVEPNINEYEAHKSSSDVTLYTRAQQAKYDNSKAEKSTKGSKKKMKQRPNIAALVQSVNNLFQDQGEPLHGLMMKRVVGSEYVLDNETYTIDGDPVLRHDPF